MTLYSKYGHRRDVRGYGNALEELDSLIPRLESRLHPHYELILTADHGCDPTAPGLRSHARVRSVLASREARPDGSLGEIEGLDFVGATVEASAARMNAMQVAVGVAGDSGDVPD